MKIRELLESDEPKSEPEIDPKTGLIPDAQFTEMAVQLVLHTIKNTTTRPRDVLQLIRAYRGLGVKSPDLDVIEKNMLAQVKKKKK